VETLSPMSSQRPALGVKELAAVALVALGLGWAYAPTFIYLSQIWSSEPNYSHGYLVVPIALLILWLRLGSLDRARLAPKWWGWVLLAGVFALRTLFYELNDVWFENATFPLAVASLTLALGGWTLFRWSLPAVAFLYFMLPLPHRINETLAGPLQHLATVGSCDVLQTMGLPAVAEGNVILIGLSRLGVAEACNGLSMLLSFLTLITATAILVRRPIWDRLILLASAIPIALVSNIMRITITGLCYYIHGTDEMALPFGIKLPHDWAGVYLMMPIALVLMWLELRVLSWLVVEEDVPEPAPAFGSMAPSVYRAAKKEPGRAAGGIVSDE
jgi:exosortase